MDNNRQIAIVGVGTTSTLAAEIIQAQHPDMKVLIVEPEIQIPIKSYHIPEIIRLDEGPNNRRTRRKNARLAKRKK